MGRKIRLISIFLAWIGVEVSAVPAYSTLFRSVTAEGEEIFVRLQGDEQMHWYEDEKGGYLVREDGFFRQASEIENEVFEERKAQLRRVQQEKQIASNFPKSGTVRVVVLLAQYADKSFVTEDPSEKFKNLFNETHYAANGSTGSVRDYYLASSDGVLDLRFDVYGPFTLSKEEEYYGGNSSSSSTQNARELVKEVVQLADESGVDFSVYDNTNAGRIDNISVITAGHNEAEGGSESSIWPHQSFVGGSNYVDGKEMSSYLMISELRGSKGTVMANIGTYCHEFGHVLGLPDLYNTKEKGTYTVGTWDIMCSGSYNNKSRTPPMYSAFEKFMLGWMTPVQLNTPQCVTIEAIESSNFAYLIAADTHTMSSSSPYPQEFFMVENRQHQGWDSVQGALPGTGLLISHITYNAKTWGNNKFNAGIPLGYDIVEAVNADPSQSSASDVYPGTGGVTSFTAKMNDGTVLEEYGLTDIFQKTDGKVSFVFGEMKDLPITMEPQVLDTFITTIDDNAKIVEYGEQKVRISGKKLSSDKIYIKATGRFRVSLDGKQWSEAEEVIEDSVRADGSYARDIYIRFVPIRQYCAPSSGQLLVINSDSTAYGLRSLVGLAYRPMMITKVDSLGVELQTTTSFRVRWKAVEDAAYYYATLLQQKISTTDSSYTEIERREVVVPNVTAMFSNLASGRRYKVVIEAAEEKGCIERISSPAEVYTYTLSEKKNHRIYPMLLDDGRYILNVGEPFLVETTMAIYNTSGTLIYSTQCKAGDINPEIPVGQLRKGDLYLIKLYSGRMSRYDYWSKFLY